MAHTPPGRTRERIFRFVRERLLAGNPPTVREVQEAFGFRAPASAREQLEALVEEGRLAKEDGGRARGYRLPARTGGVAFVPVLGRVQAGALAEAIEEADGFVAVAGRSPRDELFALHVRGESMRDAAILDGDLVIVRRQSRAQSGQIVVALVGDGVGGDAADEPAPGDAGVEATVVEATVVEATVVEATVKTLRLVPSRDRRGATGTRLELHPANPDFAPIVPPPGKVEILGVVVEVRRDLERGVAASAEPRASRSSRSGESRNSQSVPRPGSRRSVPGAPPSRGGAR